MTPKQLRRAAFILRDYAKAIRESNTIGGKWPREKDRDVHDARLKYECDEMLALSRALYGMAREVQPTKRKG